MRSISAFSFLFSALCLLTMASAATFDIRNNCPYVVWAAAVPVGGGNVSTQANSCKSTCQTGDCQGLLECQDYGSPPNTLAEFALDQYANQDFIDISNIEGFNVPMEFSSNSPGCSRVIKCIADIVGQCPNELKVPGGCNGPCPVFKTEEYCCNSGNCGPTNFSKFFKDRCPDAYSYPKDDPTSLFTCPTGTNYKVIFCP
ncbi:hypothetical protein SLE2022_086500 [Rubroshorea leprosula]